MSDAHESRSSSTPSIADVARAAGVSQATVSYVLSGNRPISEETRERVRAVIAEIGYVPNRHARALKSRRHGTIGILVTELTEPAVPPVVHGLEETVLEHDYSLMVGSVVLFGRDVGSALVQMAERGLDGVIYLAGRSSTSPVLRQCPIDLPVVGVNQPLARSLPSILTDDEDGGYRAAAHLLESGATRPAIITGPPDRASSLHRLNGFRRALEDNGVALPDANIIHGSSFECDTGERGMRALIERELPVDGVFCENDNIAAGAMNVATRSGLRIPHDLRVVGFDDKEYAGFWPIPITTFRAPLADMGRRAGEILFQMIRGEQVHDNRVLIRSRLIVRASTVVE